MRIETPEERSGELVAALVDIWERSVRATHDFLSEGDVALLRPEVGPGVEGVAALAVAYGDDGAPCGFAGVQDGKLEMLFVAPEIRGHGVGSALLSLAVERFGVETLDVNEQNPQAVGFYEHEGFVVVDRSPVDDAGRPWPLLHLRLEGDRR
ncbi:GNAT family N-acetyltransferase [Gordonibacter sp. An230]|uniref:GNAT family N-acetyltransferase n=1 Tax=Gordonibacter sp. An230 TaxID=1965592 RepID=UPI000B36D77C|nr:GNAT family N-acetyltransferase [Gordonibacter sp. An230]OUO90929.1 GNAT family N-acetyltransferase [Gordonibacter sp. An230]